MSTGRPNSGPARYSQFSQGAVPSINLGTAQSHPGGVVRADTTAYGLALERMPLIAPVWSMAGPPPLTAKEATTLRVQHTLILYHQGWLNERGRQATPVQLNYHQQRLQEANRAFDQLRDELGARWWPLVRCGLVVMPWQEVVNFRRAFNAGEVRKLRGLPFPPQTLIDLHIRQIEEDEETETRLVAAAEAFWAGQTQAQGWSWRPA